MRAGEFVLVKSFPSEPVVRCVFEEGEDGVLLCLQQEFSLWQDKGVKPLAVKCPKSLVFRYDEELHRKLRGAAYSLGDNDLLEALWNQVESYYSPIKETQH